MTEQDEPLISLEHVSVARGERAVLDDVSLQLRAGEHLVLLGPNGCGKSTLLKVLTCELYPLPRPNARVRLFGRARWDVQELRRRMGVVAAELPGESTKEIRGYEAVLTGFFSSSKLWPHLQVSAAMRERADEVVALTGAEDLCEQVVGTMSAGQQRKIMIARALAGNVGNQRMLLLDEPSNALDVRAQAELRDVLQGLAEQGVSLLMITHHVSDIIAAMQRVVLMREGRIVADGDRATLLREEPLSNLFSCRVNLVEREGILFAW